MTNKSKESERNAAFMETLVAEVLDASDEDVLEGADLAELTALGEGILQRASAEAGRRRLAAAKSRMTVVPSAGRGAHELPPVSEARSRLAELSAGGLLTLAARGLDEMPDEEVLQLYGQALQLLQEIEGDT